MPLICRLLCMVWAHMRGHHAYNVRLNLAFTAVPHFIIQVQVQCCVISPALAVLWPNSHVAYEDGRFVATHCSVAVAMPRALPCQKWSTPSSRRISAG